MLASGAGHRAPLRRERHRKGRHHRALIRVRALGSYYDALTHVRRNGFWSRSRTFELIPETLLDIPALKTDSYSGGEGSPLAMGLTFTPGVPVPGGIRLCE